MAGGDYKFPTKINLLCCVGGQVGKLLLNITKELISDKGTKIEGKKFSASPVRKTSSTCVRISGKIFFQTKDFVLSTILKQRNRASHKMVYYKKAPMLLNGNLANDSGQETIFVEWELLKVNLFVCFVCLFFFCCVKQRASFIYLKTQMSTHLKNDDPFCETDLKNFYTSKIHGGNTGQTFGWKRPRITCRGSTGLRKRQCKREAVPI